MNKLKGGGEWFLALLATIGCYLLVLLMVGIVITIFGGLIYAILGM